jgi:PAS domain S-box-containing protein
MHIFRTLFSSGNFEPHGYCYLWNPGLVWLNVVSDALIAAAYFAIPIILVWFVRKRRDLPFSWIFGLFGLFIVACGSTHVMEVWNLWHANYWLAGLVKAITAAASVPTAILLLNLVPRALELPSAKQWITANAALREEMAERREAELNLRISEASYRDQADLLDLTNDAIFVRNAEGKILYWNRGAERLYGWTKDEVRGKTTHAVLRTEFPTPLEQIVAETAEKSYWEGELVHYRKEGSKIIVSSRWLPRRDPAGNMTSILEINRDITQQRQDEEKFRNLLESAPDAMVIVDKAGQIQLVNAQTEKVFGYSREELVGCNVELLMPRRFHERHIRDREAYSESPHARAMGLGLELFGRRKDGSEFPVEISLSPLQTSEGALISSAVRDVSLRRRTEEQIRKLNAELKQKVTELSLVNRELESFSYSVSHDLRAPLRHIDGFTRILIEEHAAEFSGEAKGYLDRVLKAVTHTGQLVDDLLNLARIGRKEIDRKTVALTNIVRQAMASVPVEKERGEIEWRIEPLPEVNCDPGLMELVFTNLLANAVKFTRTRQFAVIEVGSLHNDGADIFFVRDNGVGFDPKYADKLFGVFQRLHRQEEFEGTGVGLATVQRIIHRHGGEVWAESELGRGTTFFFTLEKHQLKESNSMPEVKLGRV